MTGWSPPWLRAAAHAPAEPDAGSLAARGLRRSFGAVEAVCGVSFTVEPGELYGLVGPDGAGKTTTIRILSGLVTPDEGQALVLGRSVADGGDAAREAIGYMPQRYSLYGDLSIDENIRFFGRLFGLSRGDLEERRARLLGITRLARFGDRRADDLSGGMYKKLALACALLHRPRVLLLDEPSNGVDPVSRRELWDLLHELVADGMAVLLATPYMDEAARCHRVGLLHEGHLVAEGAPAELVAGFPHATFRVDAAERDRVEAELMEWAPVLALSPEGAGLRVVLHRDGVAELAARLPAGARFEPVTPGFEDVYLGLVAEAEQGGAG